MGEIRNLLLLQGGHYPYPLMVIIIPDPPRPIGITPHSQEPCHPLLFPPFLFRLILVILDVPPNVRGAELSPVELIVDQDSRIEPQESTHHVERAKLFGPAAIRRGLRYKPRAPTEQNGA